MISEDVDSRESVASVLGVETDVSPEQQQAIERDFWHNAAAGMLFEGTWAVGMSFAILAVLIPAYLGQLAAPKSLIGFVSSIGVLTIPLQLFSERLIGGTNRKRKMSAVFIGCGAGYITMGICGLLLAPEHPILMTSIFVATVAIFFICNNIGAPIYQAILTDNCPINRRGRLFGYRAVTIGIVGLAGLLPARWVLERFPPEHYYHAAVLFAGACFVFSSLTPLLIRDHVNSAQRTDAAGAALRAGGIRQMVREAAGMIRAVWDTPNYRVFIFFAAILAGASAVGPFVVTFADDVVLAASADPNVALKFQAVFLCASIVNGLFVGTVADRWGYKTTLAIQACTGLVAFIIAQWSPSVPAVMIAYGLLTCMASGMPAVVLNLSVELLPRVTPAQLAATANAIFLPVTVLLPWLAGSALDLSRVAGAQLWGYHLVFTVGATLTLVGVLGTLLLVQEPRTGRIYVIKVLPRT